MNDLLRALIQDVVDSADTHACLEGYTLASKNAIDGLAAYLVANPPRDRCPECNELRGRLHHPTCAKRVSGATYVLHIDCEVCNE